MNFCKNFEFYQSSKVSVSGLDLERTILIVKFLLYEQFVAFVYLWTGLKTLKLEIANFIYFEKATQNLTSKDLFMSFTTVFWDEICYDFYWEKKGFGSVWSLFTQLSSQHNVRKYRTKGHEQVLSHQHGMFFWQLQIFSEIWF